jgi:hypothetical protein
MKQLSTGSLALVIGLMLSVSHVSAHEGNVDLTNAEVSCKGISLYQDGNYRVFGRCDGLAYPYETLYNKYVLWGKTSVRGEMVRIAEVDKGYFSGNIANTFDSMMITAEKDGLVSKPSTKQVVTGSVAIFDFDKSQTSAAVTTPTTATAQSTTPQSSPSTVTSTAGAVVGKIVTSLLVIILVVVALVIGASLIFRSRGSVSA